MEAYQAFQGGVIGELAFSPAFRLLGVVGAKSDNNEFTASVFPYFKLEFVAVPGIF
ncbi:MAG TPA: hypothetical protein VFQ45_01460 [Longimicrobium sp.]|nr:hypothetical protein [Longimicrobium sp.]